MHTIASDTTVRDIVVAHPRARRFFEDRGIDYCCNGWMRLGAAAERANVPLEPLMAELQEELSAAPASDVRDWSRASLTELTDHILDTHHAFMRKQLPRIDGLLGKVARAHRPHAGMLAQLREVFDGLRAEIESHLLKEELVLFPYIKALDAMAAGRRPFEPIHCGSVVSPIAQMEHEHDAAGEALATMRTLTDGYQLPEDACPTFAELYESLRELEADLHEHIHLENNILFPAAVATERAATGE